MKFGLSADRVFACIALLLVGGYGYFAFFAISAPIQYDPLGPEGWPEVLVTTALLLCVLIGRYPEARGPGLVPGAGKRVAMAAVLLAGYALVFEGLGFMLATALFCAGFARLMGARISRAIAFGLVTGLALTVLAVYLLALNLPAGILPAVEPARW